MLCFGLSVCAVTDHYVDQLLICRGKGGSRLTQHICLDSHHRANNMLFARSEEPSKHASGYGMKAKDQAGNARESHLKKEKWQVGAELAHCKLVTMRATSFDMAAHTS